MLNEKIDFGLNTSNTFNHAQRVGKCCYCEHFKRSPVDNLQRKGYFTVVNRDGWFLFGFELNYSAYFLYYRKVSCPESDCNSGINLTPSVPVFLGIIEGTLLGRPE